MDGGELPLTRWRDLRTMFLALLGMGVIMHVAVWLMATSDDSDRDAWYDLWKLSFPAYLREENVGEMFKNSRSLAISSENISLNQTQSLGNMRISGIKAPADALHQMSTNGSASRQTAALVVLLSYQRSGSTYLGGLLGQLPGVFYMYEPLDSLYMALYGTAEGWNVPTDITNYSNGSSRPLPPHETKAVSTFLDHMINCRMSSLPTETFHHRYWRQFREEQKSLAVVYSCLDRLLTGSENCANVLRGVCNERFNSSQVVTNNLCHGSIMRMHHEIHQSDNMNMSRDAFRRHEQCLLAEDNAVARCKNKLQLLCAKSSVRAIKTVRLTMESVESLIQRNPGIKIVHLIRDPRGVLLSRSKLLSTYGLHSESMPRETFANGYVDYAKKNRIDGGKIAKPGKMDFMREAKMFCRTLYNDLVLRRRLEISYPNVFLQVVFDEFVHNPATSMRKLYDWLEINMEINKTFYNVHSNSSAISLKWKHKLPVDTAAEIKRICGRVYDIVDSSYWNS